MKAADFGVRKVWCVPLPVFGMCEDPLDGPRCLARSPNSKLMGWHAQASVAVPPTLPRGTKARPLPAGSSLITA